MPGVYGISQWDLAGCAIAVREPSWPVIPNSKSMRIGDSLIGLRSNGIHSNGFSLVRKIFEVNGISYKDRTPWDENKMFGEVLLAPTRLYVRQLLPLMKDGLIKGCAHITGGGIEENAIRVLDPKDQLSLEVDASSWNKATLFDWISEMGPVSAHEMLRTFNSGIGMVLVVGESVLSHVEQRLRDVGEEPLHIGRVVKRVGDKLINFTNMDTAFSQQKYKRTRPKVKVGILISGTGSNMVKLIEKSQRVESNCEVVVVISNKATAKGLIAARKMGVETVIVPHTPIREEGDAKMTEGNRELLYEWRIQLHFYGFSKYFVKLFSPQILRSYGVQLVCLAGYMRLMSPQFVNYWKDKILNIHPSLLPSFKGAHAVRDALQFGVKVTGCSVHYVDEEMDHGPLVAQDTVFVDVHDTEESLQMKIQAVEHKIYPEAMEKVAAKIISQQKL
uniref:Phosphoribosylformylglycinamidine cyclo-ligase n=1 Tax=Heterorhabditis bacteriophora TaxID=37862 RepID=A0A1I7X5U3_HETBA